MSAEEGRRRPPLLPGLIVREATAADNQRLIALELGSPVRAGDVEVTYDRSPDAFAAHRVQEEHRIVVGELAGRLVGVMAGAVHTPNVRGRPHRLVYVHRARIHPDFHHQGVAWALANALFAWAGARGAEGPYYIIAPENEPSIAFVQRGGGRWPVEVTLLEIDVSAAPEAPAEPVPEERLEEAAALVNATHAGEEFFEPLTAASLRGRLGRDGQYGLGDLRGAFAGGSLVAVGGLRDEGATKERVHVERATGATARSRGAAVADWGWAPGRREAFGELLRGLAATARGLGRSALTICEPGPGALPEPGLPARRTSGSLFTPTLEPPPAASVRGLYFDTLYL